MRKGWIARVVLKPLRLLVWTWQLSYQFNCRHRQLLNSQPDARVLARTVYTAAIRASRTCTLPFRTHLAMFIRMPVSGSISKPPQACRDPQQQYQQNLQEEQ